MQHRLNVMLYYSNPLFDPQSEGVTGIFKKACVYVLVSTILAA